MWQFVLNIFVQIADCNDSAFDKYFGTFLPIKSVECGNLFWISAEVPDYLDNTVDRYYFGDVPIFIFSILVKIISTLTAYSDK